jgi:RNA methyltransferase, TrmH family
MSHRSPESLSGVIRSSDNRIIKVVRSLRYRSARETERAFVVEGFRAVADALAAGAKPRMLLARADDPAADDFVRRHDIDADTRQVEPTLFDGLAGTVTPQGVLGVFAQPILSVDRNRTPMILVVDQLRDPGNLGALLRSAAGAGATLVAITAETVDPFNPKVVRAGMGAHFRVPIQEWNDDVSQLIRDSCPVRAIGDATGDVEYDLVDLTQGVALIVGSEAHGVSAEIERMATARARIPLTKGVESLNAAVAGAVLLFEAVRQRRRSAS